MQLRTLILSATALAAPTTAQLAGTYIINGLVPTGGSVFASFADATAALAAQGVGGPCEFLVYDDGGPFTEANSYANFNTIWGNSEAVLVMAQWTGSSSTNRVTFRAAPGERPVLDAAGLEMGVFWGGADHVTLHGLEIRNATFDGISLYSDTNTGVVNDAIIDSCRIHDCGSTAVTIYGNSQFPVNTLVQNCTMWRCQLNYQGAFNIFRNGYVTTRRTTNTRIVHNTFFADTSSSSDFGVICARTSSATELPYAEVSNNIVFKTGGAGEPIFNFYTPAGSSFPVPPICDSNCFFDATNSPFAEYGDVAGTTAATLLDWQIAGYDLGSFEADPLFRDIGNDDFHLTASSPCRNGSSVATTLASDADGQPRTAPLDLGADEFSMADFAVVGSGCAGAGNAPELDIWSWPFLGNAQFTVGFEAAQPSAIVGLFGSLGLAPAPLPIGSGCEIYLDGTFVALAAAATNPAGATGIVLPLPNAPSFAGFEIAYQGLVLEASAPLGFTLTNGLDVTFDF